MLCLHANLSPHLFPCQHVVLMVRKLMQADISLWFPCLNGADWKNIKLSIWALRQKLFYRYSKAPKKIALFVVYSFTHVYLHLLVPVDDVSFPNRTGTFEKYKHPDIVYLEPHKRITEFLNQYQNNNNVSLSNHPE